MATAMAMNKELLYDEDIKTAAKEIAKFEYMNSHQVGLIRHFQKDETVTYMSGSFNEIFTTSIRDGEIDRKINLIIKFALSDPESRKSWPIHDMIENEIYFYAVAYPKIIRFVDNLIDSVREYLIIPKYYRCSFEPGKVSQEWLAIKNIEPDNYQVLDRRVDLTHEHTAIIFQRYAYFNAQTYLMKEKNEEKFGVVARTFKNISKQIIESEKCSENLKTACLATMKFLKAGKDDELINKFEKYVQTGTKMLIKDNMTPGEYDTIIHGNLWINHIMFKCDAATGKPAKVRFIDWKCAKLGSPVCDLSFCLYAGGSKPLFDNLNQYIQIYYDSLTSALKTFFGNPDKIFSYNQFLDEWKVHAKFGFLMAIPVIFMKCFRFEAQNPSSFEMGSFKDRKYDEKKFENMMRDLLNHMNDIEAL